MPSLDSAAPDGTQQLPLCLDGSASSTVFVVDDDRAIREAMRDLLQENGHSVEIFADGPAFLETDEFVGYTQHVPRPSVGIEIRVWLKVNTCASMRNDPPRLGRGRL